VAALAKRVRHWFFSKGKFLEHRFYVQNTFILIVCIFVIIMNRMKVFKHFIIQNYTRDAKSPALRPYIQPSNQFKAERQKNFSSGSLFRLKANDKKILKPILC
jgi:hypothetical protein